MKTHYLNVGQRSKALHFLQALPSTIEKSTITKTEAEMLIANIAHASVRVFKNVVLLMVNKGYIALGFSKPQDCLRKRLPEMSTSYISRLLSATELYLKLDCKLIQLDKVTEATFRPLQNVDDADALKVWTRVLTVLTDKRITSRHIQRSMDALNIRAATTPVVSCTLTVDAALQQRVQQCAKRIGTQFILPHVQTKSEYDQLCQLIHKQLLADCPLTQKLVQS